MGKDIDDRVITDKFLLNYFPSPDSYNERFPYLKRNLKVLEKELQKIRDEWDKERREEGKPLLSDEEWEKIVKNAYPIPQSTLAVSEERYRMMIDNINKALQGTNIRLDDAHLEIIIKNMDGYVVLSKILKPNKQL